MVNGKTQELKIVSAGMTGIILDTGDNIIELNYTLRYFKIGLIVTVISLVLYILLILKSRMKKREASKIKVIKK